MTSSAVFPFCFGAKHKCNQLTTTVPLNVFIFREPRLITWVSTRSQYCGINTQKSVAFQRRVWVRLSWPNRLVSRRNRRSPESLCFISRCIKVTWEMSRVWFQSYLFSGSEGVCVSYTDNRGTGKQFVTFINEESFHINIIYVTISCRDTSSFIPYRHGGMFECFYRSQSLKVKVTPTTFPKWSLRQNPDLLFFFWQSSGDHSLYFLLHYMDL